MLDSVSQKPDKTPINVSYGVRGTHSDIPIQIWDRLYYFDDDKIHFEAPIDMNNKDITGVNKITTVNLDVNGQIDVKGNKIIGVGNGTADGDAVNKALLDKAESQIVEMITNLTNKVIQIETAIATINANYGYYYFTDQLKHDNEKIIKFPANENHYPFLTKKFVSDILELKLSGYYHIIYTDFYKGSGNFEISYTYWSGLDTPDKLFTLSLDKQSNWTPITINIIKKIEILSGTTYSQIRFHFHSDDGSLDGAGYSTFYIKYLHA